MPRQKRPGAREPKRRSRKGCWPCKGKKIKCGEEHPYCKNCLKVGDVCDYSVRLNWSGRHTKSQFVGENSCGNSWPASKLAQMPHEMSAENPQLLDHFMVSGQELDGADSHSEGRIQQPLAPTTVFKNMTTANDSDKQGNSFNNTLVFIDESQQHLSGAGPSEGYVAKRQLGHSQGTTSVSSSCRGSLINSPALGAAGHNKTKSFTEFTELDIGQSQSMPCPSYTQKSTSTPWPSYPDVLDSPLTPTLSSYSDDIVSRSNWTEFPSLGSPDSWLSGQGFSENSPSRSGHLSEEPGAHGLQETLSNSDVYPCGNGAFYGYDSGAADEDLLKSDDANTVVLPPSAAAYNSASGVVDFGEEAMSWKIRDRTSGLNQYYYKNVVPVVIPWALEPLPDMLKRNKMNLLVRTCRGFHIKPSP
ncbi:hypothetical protein J3458_003048 [Metarhizium acridum]|uniref:uncharacterized protein n=1 Tax=Metarhizium acridum TaxID=92637 RepID=UPI001C6B3E9B|nr:hypothetical protein J3458_003048 [Metarhizium acridum]